MIHDKGLGNIHILGRLFHIICLGWDHVKTLKFPFLEIAKGTWRKERVMLYFEE